MESEFDILTKKKLEIEIEDLQKAWFKKPKYIAALSPIIIALLSFLAIWLSGFFDTQKERLNKEISELEIVRDSLNYVISITLNSLKYQKLLYFEMILNRDQKYNSNYSDIENIYEYLCPNISDKIKFYDAIMECEDFESFLKKFEIDLKVSDIITYEKMHSDKRAEIYNNYIKGRFHSYCENDGDNCIYAYNKSSFVTDEKGKLLWETNFLITQTLFIDSIKSKTDSLYYHNKFLIFY